MFVRFFNVLFISSSRNAEDVIVIHSAVNALWLKIEYLNMKPPTTQLYPICLRERRGAMVYSSFSLLRNFESFQ